MRGTFCGKGRGKVTLEQMRGRKRRGGEGSLFLGHPS